MSLERSVHAPPQRAPFSPGHAQLPATHDWLLTQSVPHAPQFATSLDDLVSQPVAGSPSHSAKPALQVKEQTPSLHAAAALVVVAQGVQPALPHPAFGSSFETQAPLHHFWASVQMPEAFVAPLPSLPPGTSPTQALTSMTPMNARRALD